MAFAHKRRHSFGSSRKLCVLSPSLCYSSLVTDSSEENKQNEDRNQNRNGKNSTNRHTVYNSTLFKEPKSDSVFCAVLARIRWLLRVSFILKFIIFVLKHSPLL